MRILWQSNGRRAPTGYGNQTNLFLPEIKQAGYEPYLFATYGTEGSPTIDEDGIVSLPRWVDAWGNDIVHMHMQYTKAELLITLIDPFILDRQVYGQLPWCAWTPVDSEPVLPGNVRALRAARWIWAMSRFGENQLRQAGFENVVYVPHGVDTEKYKPIDRVAARQRLQEVLHSDLEGKFLIVMNSANKGQPSRKGFAEGLEAFGLLQKSYSDAVLYIHTELRGTYGEHLPDTIAALGIDPATVLFPPQYNYIMGLIQESYLNDVYNAADVYLQTSHGEGFGIPIVEAQAAGCPVLVSDFSAMRELCLSGGYFSGMRFAHAPGAWQFIPNVRDVKAMLESFKSATPDYHQYMRDEARTKALDYDYKIVAERYMMPAIAGMQAQIQAQKDRLTERAAMREALRNKKVQDFDKDELRKWADAAAI